MQQNSKNLKNQTPTSKNEKKAIEVQENRINKQKGLNSSSLESSEAFVFK